MSNSLIIDTSSSVCTVILRRQSEVAVRQLEGPRSHGQFLLSAINQLVTEQQMTLSDLHVLAVVAGPGSFTGIRIGVGVVQGLAAALDIPVILLSSLEWVARQAVSLYACAAVSVCRKAREGEFYLATFQQRAGGGIQLVGKEQVVDSRDIDLPVIDVGQENWIGAGDGWMEPEIPMSLRERFKQIDAEMSGDVESLCQLALQKQIDKQTVRPEQALPSYLKDNMHYRTAT